MHDSCMILWIYLAMRNLMHAVKALYIDTELKKLGIITQDDAKLHVCTLK